MTITIRQYKNTATWEYDIRFDLPDGRAIRERRKSKLTGKSATERWAIQREQRLLALHTALPHARLASELLIRVDPIKPWPTRAGVYVVLGADSYVKIGRAENIRDRLRTLQTGNPTPLELLAVLSDDSADEREFHCRFGRWRLGGEWFELSRGLCDAIINARKDCDT